MQLKSGGWDDEWQDSWDRGEQWTWTAASSAPPRQQEQQEPEARPLGGLWRTGLNLEVEAAGQAAYRGSPVAPPPPPTTAWKAARTGRNHVQKMQKELHAKQEEKKLQAQQVQPAELLEPQTRRESQEGSEKGRRRQRRRSQEGSEKDRQRRR